MKALSLACVLFLCAGAAQSQSVFLQYTDPSGEAFVGAQFEVELWIDFPPGAVFAEQGGVNVLYDPALVNVDSIDMVLPPCPVFANDPCAAPGVDDGLGNLAGFYIQGPSTFPPFIWGTHHVATLTFEALDEGVAVFVVEEDPAVSFGIPVTFSGVSVSIVLSTCQSPSLPENFHDDSNGGLPNGWENIFVNAQPDSDGDGVADQSDNCTLVANPTQCDTDGDSYGNHCDADLDNNCFVNFVDLGVMKRDFFMPGALDTDLNCDSITNFVDIEIMREHFFQAPGPSGLPTASCNPQNNKGGGPIGWQTTDGDHCDFTGDNVGDNVTGGLAQAACLEPLGGGPGAALCTSAPLNLVGAITPVLELNANFQPAIPFGLFQVIAGIDPPNPGTLPGYDVLYETDAPLGAFQALPGEKLVIDLPSANPLYVCVLVSGDISYAEVDHCIACAVSCGGPGPTGPSRNPDCGVERF